MATSRTQPTVGLSDPTVSRSIESQLAQAVIIANGKSTVSGGEAIFVGTTARVTASNVTLTTSANNQPEDVVTVYSSNGTTYVSAIDQTVKQTIINQTGVYAISAGNGISIASSTTGGTGTVTISSTAGNIAVINLDGNVSNVLRGNGSWGADATSAYGNSNVVSLLNAYGSNTITTTGNVSVGNIIGNGQALTGLTGANVGGFVPNANVANTAFAVAAANVSGLGNIATLNLDGNISNLLTGNGTYVAIPVVPTVGNIATLNLDGNASNVLRGDGTFGADANSSYGDSNVVSLLAAFGSNTIITTGIITADGANLSNVPYANLTGAPSLGNISNINLDGNVSNLLTGNGTYVAIPTVPTVGNIATLNLDGNSQTWLAGNGVFANIAIPSVGNIATLNLDGNVSNVLRGDGTFGADANSSYGDSNVTSLLGAFGSNTISTTGIITADGANLSNVPYANLTGAPSLGNISSINLDGNVSNLLTGNGTYVAIPVVPTVGNIATINLDGNSQTWLAGNGVFANIAIPSVGNIATINLDGNVSNVLNGNGAFVALPVINANTVIWSTAPVANTSTGTPGQAAYDSGGNLYVCVVTDTWAKFTGTTSW
jgi:hypothetical protein